MKKILCAIMVLVIGCVGLCGCGNSQNEDTQEMSQTQAWVFFKAELISEVENAFGSTYYDLSKFDYDYESIEDVGVSYEIKGEYDVYSISGEYLKTYGFSGTINKNGNGVYIDSIF